MSERNIELVRRYIAAFNARDVEAAIALCDPSIEYHSVFAGAVTGAVYHGHDGVRGSRRQSHFRDGLPQQGEGPQSCGAVGVGDVAGEVMTTYPPSPTTDENAQFAGR